MEKMKGKAVKIDEDGALVVSNSKNTNRVIAGDIIHVTK